MTVKLNTYPKMKDFGVDWLGEVPEHWQVMRLRNAVEMRVSNVDKHVKEDELPVRLCNYVDVYKNDRISAAMPFMRATANADEIARFRLAQGDVLITKDSETWNDIAVPALVREPADDLISGYHLALLRPFPSSITGGFLLRLLQSKPVAYQFHVGATGVTRYGLSHESIKSVMLPLPPLAEQSAIVRYLDYMDRRIRRYIRAKQKLIGLLEEQKQAIIHRAVTRGLDPNVPLKPSGVDTLGSVPANWIPMKLKHTCFYQEGPGLRNWQFTDKGIPVVCVSNITDRGIDFSRYRRYISYEEYETRYAHFTVQNGDLLLASSGNSWGKVAEFVRDETAILNTSTIRLNATRYGVLANEFLRLMFEANYVRAQLELLLTGSCQPNFGPSHLDRVIVALPASLDEQQAIVDWCAAETKSIRETQAKTYSEIELLREYRTRLIADVVTGKIDVREAAANLPDEPDDADLSEELDEIEESMEEDLDGLTEEAEG